MYNNPRPSGSQPRLPVAPAKPPVDLRTKYNLAPQPVSVDKIAGLVKGRASASMEEITEIIDSNTGVTQKLISLAYPKQAARLGATVQMATSRLGVNRVIVVMVGDLLTKSVIETFETMVEMTLEVSDGTVPLADHGYLTGTVRFTGENSGQVTLAFSPHLSLLITAKVMGGDLGGEEHTPAIINDAVGELVNIVTGSLQSKLSDAGLRSEVGLPVVQYSSTLPREAAIAGGSNDHFYFRCGVHTLVAHLSVDPSAPKASFAQRAPPTHGTTWRANGA
jgi:CheY-specific phosphatase CheX